MEVPIETGSYSTYQGSTIKVSSLEEGLAKLRQWDIIPYSYPEQPQAQRPPHRRS